MHWFVLLLAICMSKAEYGSGDIEPQSDVAAPPYVPSYLRHQRPGSLSFGTKTGYQGTKSGYGTKSSYGTKTSSSGTKSGYRGSHSYTGSKSWPTNTGSVAQYEDFYHSANRPYTPRCNPPCQNEGICVDGTTCHCPPDNSGKYCEFKKVPCLTHPPMPTNSEKYCSAEFCTFTCLPGHKYPDGSTVDSMRCVQGQWQPTRAGEIGLSDCYPVCEPACMHDGVCLSGNQCQCPRDRRGPQCQYSADDCTAAGLGFNGGYSCHGDGESFSCSLSCAPGSTFSEPPARQYTCLYSTGIFEPQPIPHCVVEEIVIVTPSNYHHAYEVDDLMQSRVNTSYSETHHSETHHTVTQVIVQDLTPKPGTCLVWAGTHYKTFDGHIYSFKSPCQHVLLRTADKSLMVALRHKECRRRSSCPAELTFFVGDKEYVLTVDDDGSVIFRSSRRLIPVPARLPGLAVSQRGSSVAVALHSATVTWDTDNVILIEASALQWNKTEGLCGTLDGVAETDMKLEDGSQAKSQASFVASWQTSKIGETCDSTPSDANACVGKSDEIKREAKQFCTKIFSHSKFRKCSAVMDVMSLLETCQWDYCSGSETLSSEESACATVGVYAKECFRHGVEDMKTWRDDETCPMQCPDGKIYKSCGPESPPSCAFPEISIKPTNETCVEGCFCPEDLLLEAGKCVPKEQCPCRLRNRSFEPGATVTKECNTCKCQSGEWTCTKQSCGARCGTYGDPHYTTFDGLRYDFMGRCTYYLVLTDNLTVEVENVACSYRESESQFQPATYAAAEAVGKPSCTKTVTVRTAGVVAQLKQAGLIVVNGKEVTSLPVTVGDVLIRAASSLFVIVQLPSGVDIWWDGKTRTYVDVPPEFHDKTKGLCGTFNQNQKDDFLTTEGDVEQSAFAFANKWKTREACSDISTKEPEHPCEANVLNKEAAEKYCSKLRSNLFESCHWYVDVTPFYEACLYDMCACAGDVSRCLCAVLGDYAGRCAAAGVHLQWRYNVKECEVSCTGGQEYTVCADSCARTCADVALAAAAARRCRPACVEGCACARGQVLDENNVCVPIAQCPCYHEGMEFKPGYKEVRAGRREQELCTCIGSRWDCAPATPDDIQRYPAAGDLRSNCSAARHMEFTTCEAAPLTCKNMHLPKAAPSTECRPGCVCQKGYVMDMTSQSCVLPTQCPCHHGGRSYPDGESVTEECNTCTCKSGNWSCSARACAGVCAAWGDSHVLTYDGAQYDFEGVCSYLLAKGCLGAGRDEFQVDIQNVPCGTTGATCSKSVTLKVGGGGEETVELTVDAPLPDVSALTRIKLREAGVFVFLDVPSLGVALQWDRGMRVYVRALAMWNNRVKGLCGNFNGDLRDDFQTPSGGDIAEASALIFADSWKLKPTCPKPEAVRDHCQQRPERKGWAVAACGAMKRHPFSLCHTEVPPGPFVDRCERDACACDSGDDCHCACTALAMYAHLCAARGVVFKWRRPELCPMQCDEECSTYDACMSPCPAETCDNTLYYEEIKTSCAKDACVEGCKPKEDCAEGTVYANATSKSCVPRATCKPVCMRVDGRVVLEGELLEQDACHTCTCSRGKRVCTGQPCPTDPTPLSTPSPAPPPLPPSLQDEQLKCLTGWTEWLSQAVPATNGLNESIEAEPLPEAKRFPIGTPMCKPAMMKQIECRTLADHRPAKDTGLDVECSLERGLLCKETDGLCPDFEIRVYCQCDEEPFQCLDSTRPSHPHPTDCNQFYECTPEGPAGSAHAVLKACAEGLMYNPRAMVCDWPAAVEIVRPECKNTTGESTEIFTGTTPTVYTVYTVTLPTTTQRACPVGQVYKECAFPCDKLCDHFKKTVIAKRLCMPGQKCIEGCIDEAVASTKCESGSLWRDEKTCVPIKDCTCFSEDGKIVKPGGVTSEGCIKCQCLDDAMHCDSSECVSAGPPAPGPTHQSMVVTVPPRAPTTPAPLVIITATSPPPQCPQNRYVNLVEDLPESSFSSSSVVNVLFAPQYAKLNAHPSDIDAGCWSPLTHDQNQFIQVEFERREPLYGVIMQGSPLFDQYVTSYELMYGDQPNVFETLKDSDGKPRILRGPIDHNNAVKQMFNPPIEAKYVRIRPLTWHDEISLRFELIGCHEDLTTTETTTIPTTPLPMKCKDLLGLAAGLPVENIEVSSNSDKRNLFRLDGDRGWTPLYSTPGEWIMFDFESPREITGIKTAGGPSGWVTAYQIMYTSDLSTFSPVLDKDGATANFPGNSDAESVALNQFELPIHARYLKVLPVRWHGAPEMRIEPLGCFEPYSVPMKCKDQLGLAAGLPVENIEVSSNSDKRNLFRLDGQAGWTPLYSTPGEWIMFDFESPREITGIKTAGGPSGWVTAYQIMYTSDLSTFSPVLDKDGATANFPGNSDAESVALNQFELPIHARYLKVLPVRWHGAPEMRIEPLGCFEPYRVPIKCKDQLGLAAGLPVENIEVSSNSDKRNLFRLDGARGWTPLYSTPGEWIMFDFQSPREITGIKTAGGPSGWVTAYQIMYTSDLSTFSPVLDKDGATANFPGNSDAESVALNQFELPIHARYLKVLPVRWHGAPEMRIEPLGCFEPYIIKTPRILLSPTTSAPMKCTDQLGLAAGLPVENIEVSSNSDKRNLFRLDGQAGWTPLYSTPGEWIMFDFQSPREITGIKTAGGPSGWVTAYQIMYTSDLSTFSPVLDKDGATANFPGNSDAESVALNQFELPIHARYLKVLPVRWHGAPEMRIEPLGCFEPYIIKTPRIPLSPTTSAPMKCTDQLGLAAGLPVGNIEVSSNSDKRNLFRLDGQAGWTPLYSTPGEWIMFDFQSPREITGIKTAGGPSGWVTAYQIMYTSDLSTFSPVLDKDGATANFPGNSDAESVALNQFELPIHARYLKVLPVRWHGAPEMRIEPLGCFEPYIMPPMSGPTPAMCMDQLGLAAGLPVENIEVSSNSDKRNLFRLDGDRGWTPLYNTPGEWIMFDFQSPREITGLKTAGGPSGWVTAYQIMYTSDLSTFSPVLDKDGATANFPGNSDAESVALNQFELPIHARYLKVLPVRWHGAPEMRIEPLGCFEPYSVPVKCMDQLGLAAGLPVENIEVSSNSDKRNLFRLDGDRGWTPLYSTPGEWIMFDFQSPREITGIKTAGGPSGWVTAYQIMYTSDLSTFSPVLDKDGATANFPGNSDAESVALNQFELPIHARYLKVLPVRWHGAPEMRIEPLGCFEPYMTASTSPMKCTDELGLAAGLPVENIEVSSNSDKRNLFRLDGQAGWTPLYSTPGEWIMFDFEWPREITGIKTAGGPSGWVTAYQIMYTSDLSTFSPVLDKDGATANFPGNSDAESVALNQFELPIHARYLKVLPVRWHGAPEMRIEPLGCFEPYTVTTTYRPCALCPGAMAPSTGACACSERKFYDGENCVSRDQCPCFVGFMSYAVGATFRGTNCDECLCKLGGVTICRAPADCKCQPDLVPIQSKDTCACQCEPCRNGTRICPTSKLCLALDKWCDGLQDCPDDEVACTTVGTTSTTLEPTVVTTQAPTVAALVSTPKPKVECPTVECPRGYSVHYISGEATPRRPPGAALPPPRPRLAYQRYHKGGRAGTKSYRGYSGAKTGFAKGGYSAYQPPKVNQDFTLDAPTVEKPKSQVEECRQFKCVPKLPPYRPGVKPPPCSTPLCPPHYSLKLEAVATRGECPQYVCVPPPERPVYCNMTGRTISTFDGSEYKYDVCFHILARDASSEGAWTVIVRKKCRIDSCQNELMIRQDDQLILLKPNLMIEYNNYEYSVEQTSLICFQKNSFNLDKLGNGLVVTSRKYNFTVLFTSEGDVKVGVYKTYLNAVDGLCGFYDGDASNDRRLPGGRAAVSVETFGEAWAKPGLPRAACRSRAVPPELQRRRWALCEVIAKEPLSRCGKVLNLDRWRNICLEKICDCVAMEVNGSRRTEEQCRCLLLEQFVAECLAADKDIELDWRTQMDCPAVCPGPLVHYDCYRRSCEPQCSTLGAGRRCEGQAGQCTPGCYCPEGQLRRGDACVAPQDCLDCACSGAGTKYTTFERDDLPLGGNCTYLATRDRNETEQYIYQVYATNGACEGNSATICTKVIHLIHEHKVIRIEPNPQTKKLQVTVEGAMVFEYPARLGWVSVRQLNGLDVVVALTDAHVALRVQPSMEFEVRVPSHLFANRTQGLCGVCAGYMEHLVTSSGNLTDDLDEYSNSWQAKGDILTTLGVHPQEQCDEPVEEECVPPPPEKNPCYNILNVEKFGACHALLDPQSFLESCSLELCAGAEPCAALQRYAADCRRQGVCLDWRGDALCPYRRCESPLVYRPCMGCELTCDNYDEMSDVSCDKQLVEGCYCPEGKVRVNDTCIEPAKCFPCDANKEHYAGEEWQKDACTKCTCSKLPKENVAHVACVTQACSQPVCSEGEDLKTKPAKPGACCQEYVCVAQPIHTPHCEEPKQIECGFGQVVKQKRKPDGCMEFTCECKPASECPPLPSPAELPPLEPGVELVRDDSGCCPRAAPACRPAACPARPACAPPRLPLATDTGACCPKYDCVVPKDKCLVTLAWEASMNGGEVPRKIPEEVLKDLDASWADGPCRSCRCGPAGAVSCAAHSCAAPPLDRFVLAPRPVPLACCPRHERVACRYRGRVYQPGEKWQSEDEPCKSYECKQMEDLELVTNVQTCHADCQLGWQYVPPATSECCGKCVPVACVVDGHEHKVGSHWVSPDFCTNYTCLDVNGTLQVQSANETCPEVPEAALKEFVLSEVAVPGKCCKLREPVACRVGDLIYSEGQSWPTPDPCTNTSCARSAGGRLAHVSHVQTCARDCPRAWRRGAPARGRCCGDCEQVACLQDDRVKPIGAAWRSADNCTTYSCERSGADVLVTSSREACPGVADCLPDRLYLDGCCLRCRVESLDQKIEPCKPESLPDEESVGIVRLRRRGRGLCANGDPLPQFKECRGSCVSGTLYNNHTGSHDSKCECCQVIKYEPLDVLLRCEDGSTLQHQVGSPVLCACRACGEAGGLVSRPTGTKTGTGNTGHTNNYADSVDIPEMYRRFGGT